MSKKESFPGDASDLRQRAEEKFNELDAEPTEALSPEKAKRLFQELRVHQIELEMQNEELRRAQHELDFERARYFDLYNLAPVSYCTLSEKGVILEANLTAATMLGEERGALAKRLLTQFIFKEDQDIYYQHRKQLFETGEPQRCELRIVKKNGTSLWAHLVATIAQSADGAPVCRVVLSDITALKRAEEEHARFEAELRQTQKIEVVGRLAGGVAHDFNNMLSVIIGHTELALLEVDPSHPLYSRITEIRMAAERSAALTRQLLAFARKQIIAPKVIDLNETVASILKMLKHLIGENIDLNWQPGADLWPVNIDPSQIDQILVNLLVNARDSIADVGKITIKTSNSHLDDGSLEAATGEYVRIIVSDNGCGMDKETLEHIFEPFFTTREVGKGTGLGLASVYGAVKQNNGFIYVDSRLGEGTTFTIYLPRYLSTTGGARAGNVECPAITGHETILLVEDEPAILGVTRLMLEIQGYNVLGTISPIEAVRLAREHAGEIRLLITDLIMPEMNGRTLATTLASFCPGLKKLFISGYTADIIAKQGVLDEESNFLQKPFVMNSLAAKVREVLDSR